MQLCHLLSVVWTAEAIEKLLDRSKEGEREEETEKHEEAYMGMNEYLRSFKVASYHVKEGEQEVGSCFRNPHLIKCKIDPEKYI